MTSLGLAFMGTPDFAVPSLAALLDGGHDIVSVYCQPPRPAGRGQKEKRCPVHDFAVDRGLEVRTPHSLKDPAEHDAFARLNLDAAIVAAYGLILPQSILQAPILGCFNVHASLLPRWRGAAPIHRAMLAGDTVTGVSIMGMEEGLDTGPIFATAEVPLEAHTTAGTLHDQLADLGARLMAETLPRIAAGEISPVPQSDDGVTYADKLRREEGRIDWRRPAEETARKIRAFDPWPGVWFEHDGQRIKVLAAHMLDEPASAEPGTIVRSPLVVACGDGSISLERLQRPGKAPLDISAFLRGYALEVGERLG